MCYVEWEDAFLCLKSDVIPCGVRQKFCETIKGLFVGASANESVTDTIVTSFIYKDLNLDDIGRRESQLNAVFPKLYEWILEFITNNYRLNINDPSKNLFLKSVFGLLGLLIKFGYFNKHYPLQDVINASMRLLDGQTDTPFYFNEKVGMTEEEYETYRSYTDGKRFLVTDVVLALWCVFSFPFWFLYVWRRLRRKITHFWLPKVPCWESSKQLWRTKSRPASKSLSATFSFAIARWTRWVPCSRNFAMLSKRTSIRYLRKRLIRSCKIACGKRSWSSSTKGNCLN